MNFRFSISLAVLAIFLATGCTESVQNDAPVAETTAEVREVGIIIDAEEQILLNDEAVTLKNLRSEILSLLGDEQAEFVITVTPQTPMGLIGDVRQQLPLANTAGVSFPSPQG